MTDCILALSFLKLAHRISAIRDRELFFNDLLTSSSRLRSTYPVLLDIFFNLAAWRPLSSQGLQNKDTKCRISTSEEAALHHLLLGWHIKQQYQGQKVLLKNWGCLFLERHCFNNFV